jgi:hypothetical protein
MKHFKAMLQSLKYYINIQNFIILQDYFGIITFLLKIHALQNICQEYKKIQILWRTWQMGISTFNVPMYKIFFKCVRGMHHACSINWD